MVLLLRKRHLLTVVAAVALCGALLLTCLLYTSDAADEL